MLDDQLELRAAVFADGNRRFSDGEDELALGQRELRDVQGEGCALQLDGKVLDEVGGVGIELSPRLAFDRTGEFDAEDLVRLGRHIDHRLGAEAI